MQNYFLKKQNKEIMLIKKIKEHWTNEVNIQILLLGLCSFYQISQSKQLCVSAPQN